MKPYKNLGYEKWAEFKEYGKRWSVETAYSTFKMIFGESCKAKTVENITREIMSKVFIYNMFIDI
ncbi:MAG: transposase [Methanotrichaceae archaeon]